MLQPAHNQATKAPATTNTYTPVRTAVSPTEQASIGPSVVIKGEITGSEPLYIDGRVEGSIHVNGQRVTIGRNGSVTANIDAKEVVIMGSVKGNIQCTDRLDIRSEGSLTGDVTSPRISVEDGALLKGSVEVRTGSQKQDKAQTQASSKSTASEAEKPKAAAAGAGA
ncbi:MAG TPA: polymer-forming cytoskeletal protein [Terriglobales bacterium]|nr:polymer-forming cytoskeletal protein [Terriglobales bacterium]